MRINATSSLSQPTRVNEAALLCHTFLMCYSSVGIHKQELNVSTATHYVLIAMMATDGMTP